VLEVLNGERSEIGRIYGDHRTILSKWKRRFLEHAAEVFGGNDETARYEKRIAELERLLGQKEAELALLNISWEGAEVEEKVVLVEEHRSTYGLN
jgi:transposase-like protein